MNEEINECDLCCGREFDVIDSPGHILRCRECGYMFTSPRRSFEKELEHYDEFSAKGDADPEQYIKRQEIFSERLKALQASCPSGKILDVGAGGGDFLYLCSKTGKYEIFGTEVVTPLIRDAKCRYGLRLDKGLLKDMAYPAGSFDAVTMWHVLEHVPSPTEVIRQVHGLLKEGGIFLVAVPNESVWGRPQFITNKLKIFLNTVFGHSIFKLKKMYPVYEEEQNWHLSHFTPETLSRYLRKQGFAIKAFMPDANWDRYHPSAAKSQRRYLVARLLWPVTRILFFNAMLMVARKERSL